MQLLLLFYTICLCLVTGCGQISNLPFDPPYRPSEKERIANVVLKKAAMQLKRETGLIPCGTGGGMMREVRMLALSFDYRKPIGVDRARELVVIAIDTLVQTINEEEKIRPYLYHYPFRPDDVDISIVLRNEDGSTLAPGQLLLISSADGIIKYRASDPQAPLPRFMTVTADETYAEAVGKLRIPVHQATAQR